MGTLLRSPIFWIGLSLLLLMAIIFDLSLGLFLTVKEVSAGRWNEYILSLGASAIGFDILSKMLKKPKKSIQTNDYPSVRVVSNNPLENLSNSINIDHKFFKNLSRLAFLISFFWVWRDFGFLESLYFSAILVLLTRFLSLVIWIIRKNLPLKKAY